MPDDYMLCEESDPEKLLAVLRSSFFPDGYEPHHIYAYGLLQAEYQDKTISLSTLQSMRNNAVLVSRYIALAKEIMSNDPENKNHIEVSAQLASLINVSQKTHDITNSTHQLLGEMKQPASLFIP